MGRVGEADNSGYAYAMSRAFSEMMARDAVWETDEVEWVAGICVLRAVIRTAMRGDRRQRDEYDELLRTYEGRWKEIKDEARQAVVTVRGSLFNFTFLPLTIFHRRFCFPQKTTWRDSMRLCRDVIYFSIAHSHLGVAFSGLFLYISLSCML